MLHGPFAKTHRTIGHFQASLNMGEHFAQSCKAEEEISVHDFL